MNILIGGGYACVNTPLSPLQELYRSTHTHSNTFFTLRALKNMCSGTHTCTHMSLYSFMNNYMSLLTYLLVEADTHMDLFTGYTQAHKQHTQMSEDQVQRERDTDPAVRSKSNRSPGWSGASTQIIFRFCRGIRTENNTFRVHVPSQPDRPVCGSALMTGRNGTDYWNSGRLADTEGTFSTVPELEMIGCYRLTRPPGQTHTVVQKDTDTYRHMDTHIHTHMNTQTDTARY